VPTKATFIKEADAICIRTDSTVLRKIKELAKAHPALIKQLSEKAAAEKAVTLVALPEIQREAEGLGALTPPKGDAKEMKQFVSEIETGVREVEKDPARFTNDYGAFLHTSEFGTKYGFKSCNEPL